MLLWASSGQPCYLSQASSQRPHNAEWELFPLIWTHFVNSYCSSFRSFPEADDLSFSTVVEKEKERFKDFHDPASPGNALASG